MAQKKAPTKCISLEIFCYSNHRFDNIVNANQFKTNNNKPRKTGTIALRQGKKNRRTNTMKFYPLFSGRLPLTFCTHITHHGRKISTKHKEIIRYIYSMIMIIIPWLSSMHTCTLYNYEYIYMCMNERIQISLPFICCQFWWCLLLEIGLHFTAIFVFINHFMR